MAAPNGLPYSATNGNGTSLDPAAVRMHHANGHANGVPAYALAVLRPTVCLVLIWARMVPGGTESDHPEVWKPPGFLPIDVGEVWDC
eukprot:3862945-Rhodomonas_salina.8